MKKKLSSKKNLLNPKSNMPKITLLKIVLVILLVVFLAAFGCKKKETSQEQTPSEKKEEVIVKEGEKKDMTQPFERADKKEETKQDQKTDEEQVFEQSDKVATLYGTYTNKDKESYKNLKDLKSYATLKMQNWLDKMMVKPQDPKAPFYGVTTKVLSKAKLELTSEKATVLVTCQREEIKEKPDQSRVFYQMLVLSFKKEEGTWKLDGAWWQ